MEQEHHVEEPITLLEFLLLIYPDSSKNKLRRMLTENRIFVDTEPINKAKQRLVVGQKVTIKPQKSQTKKSQEAKQRLTKFELIYEDQQILAVSKPANLLSIATDKLETETLHSYVIEYLRKQNSKAWAWIVHRLDKKTSGIMLFAKNQTCKENIQLQFANRTIHRTYYALVEGTPNTPQGTIHNHLFEDKNLRVRVCKPNTKGAKEAITHWQIETKHNDTTLVQIMIETGRRHQIRIHMSEMGHPVIGDVEHGASLNSNKRLGLHAFSLEFIHPETAYPIRLESPLPSL